ncbi:cathecol O-methyltransferase 1-like [Prosopis cineraria]|uniref:cathecol O-methyltransferase 1-like n=1 Tax=Prosopis cineraria TaxID=364024 RepID=UPI00240F2898|nr:cathecol O-methyltransferase 1-like [Prosopis cineraria]
MSVPAFSSPFASSSTILPLLMRRSLLPLPLSHCQSALLPGPPTSPLFDFGRGKPRPSLSSSCCCVLLAKEESFSHAMQLVTPIAISMALQTAVQLGVFDVIHGAGPGTEMSAAEIASELSCKNPEAASALDRLLHLLASHSVLCCSVIPDENGGPGCFRRLYGLSPVAKFFVRNTDGASLGPVVELAHNKVFLDSWSQLKDAILNGDISFNGVHGSHAFEYMRLDSRFNHVFSKAMMNHSTIVMNKILESYQGFGDITRLVDVGGGLGITLKSITSKYPNIQGINFDLPHVIQHAPPYPGVQHVGGNMFESIPRGDAIFMKWILHDWSDEWCLKLLKNCHDAIPKDGKVIVVEAVLPFVSEISAAAKSITQSYVMMLTYCPGGKERTEHEFMKLATSAGFRGIRFDCFVRNFWIMEFFK